MDPWVSWMFFTVSLGSLNREALRSVGRAGGCKIVREGRRGKREMCGLIYKFELMWISGGLECLRIHILG